MGAQMKEDSEIDLNDGECGGANVRVDKTLERVFFRQDKNYMSKEFKIENLWTFLKKNRVSGNVTEKNNRS